MEVDVIVDGGISFPHGIVRCKDGSFFFSDQNNHLIRKLVPIENAKYKMDTVCGNERGYVDGDVKIAQFNFIGAVSLDKDENLYIADANNHKIRILHNNGTVSTFIPQENGIEHNVNRTRSLVIDRNSEYLYYINHNQELGKVHLASRKLVAKIEIEGEFGLPRGLALDNDNNLYFTSASGVWKVDINLKHPPQLFLNHYAPRSLLIDRYCNFMYIGSNDALHKFNMKTKSIQKLGQFSWALGMALDGRGNLLLCEYNPSNILRIKVGGIIPWSYVRLVWLGYLKNDEKDCCIARLPRELLRCILEFCVIY